MGRQPGWLHRQRTRARTRIRKAAAPGLCAACGRPYAAGDSVISYAGSGWVHAAHVRGVR